MSSDSIDQNRHCKPDATTIQPAAGSRTESRSAKMSATHLHLLDVSESHTRMAAVNLQTLPDTAMKYDFVAPPRIVFGWGRRAELPTLAQTLGRRALLVTGSRSLQSNGTIDELVAALRGANIEAVELAEIHREPETADVDAGVERAIDLGLQDDDFVLAVGGGAALDLGKAIAAMVTNREGSSVADYLEGVGRGLTLRSAPLPVLAMPTTAGTGSEATKNAVISNYDPTYKKSLRSDQMAPRVVIVDPELTVSVPPAITAATGMDAITQLIESYISCRAQPIAQAIAISGLRLALPALAIAYRDGAHRPAREAMAHAALLSGMALANSGLGMAHGVAAALGVHCHISHGLACAAMLPATLRTNRDVSRSRLAELARAVLVDPPRSESAAADALIECIDGLCADVDIPRRLGPLGVTPEQIPALVQASRGNSMSGNPREVSDGELSDILESML